MMAALTLCAGLALGLEAGAGAPLDADTIKWIEGLVAAPVNELSPEEVEEFMELSPRELPDRLRPKVKARQFELQVLRELATTARKGSARAPEKDCKAPEEAKSDDEVLLKMAGFIELKEEEIAHVMKKSNCSETDLLCEFSLNVVGIRDPRTGKIRKRRYFMHKNDPLLSLVASYRGGKKLGGQTNFFKKGSPFCSE